MAKRDLFKASQSRVFTLTGGAGPGTTAVYQGLGRVVSPDWAGGDITPVRVPSSSQYSQYEDVDEIIGIRGRPTLGLEVDKRRAVSDFLTLFQQGCPIDIQVHVGACTDPTDFTAFELTEILEDARLTNYSASDEGALDADQEALVRETLPFTGRTFYQVVPIRDTEIGGAEIVQEVVGTIVADRVSCGDCGIPSDGAQVIFAVTKSHGGSPGLPAKLVYSANAGGDIDATQIDSIAANEDPTGLAAVGTDIVVISAESESLHYAAIADILAASETWAEVTTGFVGGKGPLAIYSAGRAFTWIAAEGGYIYFASDITAGVTVQTAGVATSEDLHAIHGIDEDNIVAVGDNNAVLVTANGGDTWQAITGPNVGEDLTCVAMRTKLEWMIGDAGGQLWYTRDGGLTWIEKAFSGSGTGIVHAITFATKNVGYMAHSTTAPSGRIFRTIDGGATWQRLPGGGVAITDHDLINSLAVATSAPENTRANLVYAGGLGANAVDGIWLKIA